MEDKAMKTIIVFLLKIYVAAMVSFGVACVLIAHNASDNLVAMTYFCLAILVSAVLGVFNERIKKTNYDSIKHHEGIRKAA